MRSQFTELHRQDYTDRATQGNTGHMDAEPHRRRNHPPDSAFSTPSVECKLFNCKM